MTEQIKKVTTLTGNGVKAFADMWRTFNGVHYVGWTSFPDPARIAAYRAAGLKCRRVGEELFMRHTDQQAAADIDDRDNAGAGDTGGEL